MSERAAVRQQETTEQSHEFGMAEKRMAEKDDPRTHPTHGQRGNMREE